MKRNNKTLGIAIIVTLIIGAAVSFAGGQEGVQIGPISLFLLCGIIAFAINWLVFIPSNIAQTERFYDLTGSITYISVILVAITMTPELDTRAKLVAIMVAVWAIRLGSFLFLRIRKDGHDDRFNEIKVWPLRFFMAWTIQGLWVLLTAACALAIITGGNSKPIGLIGLIGIAMWVIGFLIEVIADAQKRAFRRDKSNQGHFIKSGLWAWSRHPNYFGEMLLWSGVAVMALPVLQGWQWVCIVSPFFVVLLISKLSGIPTLQKKAEKMWGDDPEYQKYLANTSLLIPMPPKKS